MSNATKPVAKIGFPVTAAIWRNEKGSRAYYSATFQLSYKDDAGEWKRTSTFAIEDLLALAKVADMAHTEMCKYRKADRDAVQLERPASDD